MTLVDTSVWIDFFRGRATEETATLEALVAGDHDILLCGLVLTEILQGMRRDRDFERTRARLCLLPLLPMAEPVFTNAASIYRTLRKRGITIRRTNDCLIAAIAVHHGVALLHADADFDRIGRVYPLERASLPSPE